MAHYQHTTHGGREFAATPCYACLNRHICVEKMQCTHKRTRERHGEGRIGRAGMLTCTHMLAKLEKKEGRCHVVCTE